MPIPTFFFRKIHILACNHLFWLCNKNSVCLCIHTITNKNSSLSPIIKLLQILSNSMCISDTPKYSQMSHFWLHSIPCLMWVFPLIACVGDTFDKDVVVITTSAQNFKGKFFTFSILLDFSTKVLFFLSATPFCWRKYGAVNWCLIPNFLQHRSNPLETSSPPIYVLNSFNLWLSPLQLMPRALENKQRLHAYTSRYKTNTSLYNY